MDSTEVLAGEQAGHLFHRDRRIGWLAAGEVAQQPGEPRPAAHALSILARVSAVAAAIARDDRRAVGSGAKHRSEEHTSELQSLMRISYAVFCLKKKKRKDSNQRHTNQH